jgi:hypothetical protein
MFYLHFSTLLGIQKTLRPKTHSTRYIYQYLLEEMPRAQQQRILELALDYWCAL